jgi:hypothetical protein
MYAYNWCSKCFCQYPLFFINKYGIAHQHFFYNIALKKSNVKGLRFCWATSTPEDRRVQVASVKKLTKLPCQTRNMQYSQRPREKWGLKHTPAGSMQRVLRSSRCFDHMIIYSYLETIGECRPCLHSMRFRQPNFLQRKVKTYVQAWGNIPS